jgi:hypothetical protein
MGFLIKYICLIYSGHKLLILAIISPISLAIFFFLDFLSRKRFLILRYPKPLNFSPPKYGLFLLKFAISIIEHTFHFNKKRSENYA